MGFRTKQSPDLTLKQFMLELIPEQSDQARDVYYHGWDVSHELTPPKDKERQYQMERSLLMDKTSRVANKVIKR